MPIIRQRHSRKDISGSINARACGIVKEGQLWNWKDTVCAQRRQKKNAKAELVLKNANVVNDLPEKSSKGMWL